ncbi:MAG: methionine--tRNA ligase [Candidatus Nanoarchaeia archaeon]|nr:methionine--tRNA ligase [Candidatus Nanoarchaeia archaeon]
MSKRNVLITTAIDYPNAKPHIGHAYEKVCADFTARWFRFLGDNVHFSTGVDEHGLKIYRVAEKNRVAPQKFVDAMSENFKNMDKVLDIKYDDFIRTSEERHKKSVLAFYKKLYEKGDIYKAKYKGLYCVGCETFYTEKDIVDGKCPIHKNPVEEVEEESYFFKMAKYQKKLVEHIKKNKDFLQPESRRKEILNRLKEPLKDLSISRTSFTWGIPIPNDKKHVMYVWTDALANYLSTIDYPKEKYKKFWPAYVHHIGKDIVWHHVVIWGSLLMSAGLKLPKHIFGHGFINVKGEKMSKTTGDIVDPVEITKQFPSDAVRYSIIRETPFGEDGNFSEENLIERWNNEVVNNYGNLFYRITSFAERNFSSSPYAVLNEKDKKVLDNAVKSVLKIEKLMSKFKLKDSVEEIMNLSAETNKYFQENEPWAKIKTNRKEAEKTIYISLNLLAVITSMLNCVIPKSCGQALDILNIKPDFKSCLKLPLIKKGHKIKKTRMLFSKIEVKESFIEKESDTVEITDFQKLKIKIATIKKAVKVEGSDKLYKLEIELDNEKRQIVAGIASHYKEDDIIGKQIAVLANLKPAKIKGVESNGMLLAAEKNGRVALLVPDKKIDNGADIH